MTGWGASEWTGVAQIGALLVMLAVVHRPLGDYMATVFTTPRHLAVERAVYRVTGVGADREQRWPSYLRAVLVFSLLGVLLVFGFQRLQAWLPLSMGMEPVAPDLAWNTAISFVTNTNWQSYSGEATMSTLTQMAALAVQNFLSAAVGLAVVIALIRGLARHGTDLIGNFWVDLTRGVVRILLPLSVLFAIVLLLAGVAQNLNDPTTVTTLTGTEQTIPGGTVASQEAIKLLGTNGGGYFNANSAHPFENPTSWTNLLQIFLLLLIPSALPRTFGRMVGSLKQGYAVLAAMGVLWVLSLAAVVAAELSQQGGQAGGVGATGTTGVGMEGRDTRFGLIPSALFAVSTTLTSTGAVDSFHSSYSPLGGGTLILNMLLGEIAPGGVGSGLYGMLVVAILGVFICGLMVGRTPEYLGKKVGATQIKLISLYLLATPLTVLVGSAIAFALPATQDSLLNPGSHGFSEVLYAFTSAGNNNGSAFAGLAADTPFFNVALGLAMVIGRFLPIVMVLALAGSFAIQQRVPASAGTLPTHTPLFVGVMVGTALIVTALAYLPALALGPLAEAL